MTINFTFTYALISIQRIDLNAYNISKVRVANVLNSWPISCYAFVCPCKHQLHIRRMSEIALPSNSWIRSCRRLVFIYTHLNLMAGVFSECITHDMEESYFSEDK